MSLRIALFLSLIYSSLLYGQADKTTAFTSLPLQEINAFLVTKSNEDAKKLLLDAIKKTAVHSLNDRKLQVQYRQHLIRIYNTQGNYTGALEHAFVLYTHQKKISAPSELPYTKALINLAYFYKTDKN